MQHEHHRVPVTALAFWTETVVLTGEGPILKAYDVNQKTLLATTPVFDGQAIHGIAAAENETDSVLIWAGRYVCDAGLKRSTTGHLEVKLGAIRKANDWILDASLCTWHDGHMWAALVTAHNALELLKLDDTEEPQSIVSGSNCILYCAHVTWLSGSQCLIASGTAFGDMIVWSCDIEEHQGKLFVEYQTHYTFSAHEGSVFGVRLASSILVEGLTSRQRVLATCSDDRTVRLWDISDLSVRSPTFTEQQRQTGFGSTQGSDSYAPPALAKAMGHISRIWHVRIEQRGPTGHANVLTFGEDASCITWAIKGSTETTSRLPYSLVQAGCRRAHNGKNIWSLAIGDSKTATGGADGAIALQVSPRAAIESNISPGIVNLDNGEDSVGVFRAYGFVNDHQIVASTDKGALFVLTPRSSGPEYVKVADPIPGFRGYSVMATLEDAAFIAGSDGQVYLYQHEVRHLSVIVRTSCKVAGLFAQRLSCNRTTLLVTSMGNKEDPRLVFLDTTTRSFASLEEVHSIKLPKAFVVTSFAVAGFNARTFVFLGSRDGSIAAFALLKDSMEEGPQLAAVHEAESVTHLSVSTNGYSEEGVHLVSTGRDGTYAVHKVGLTEGGELHMATVHQLSLPFGPNIEGSGRSDQNHLWVWGFRSTQFVVFDVQAQQEIMTVECGGAHRIWTFQPTSEGGMFVWTKASKLYFQHQAQFPFQLLNAGGHGREIKSTAVSPDFSKIIATGAEDTDIKLHLYEDGNFRCLHTLQKHNTGIQHLQWSKDGRHLFSSGGFEEFFVWKIAPDLPDVGIGVVCESVHPRSGTSDLRIMHFDVHEALDGSFDITTVYSDSTISLWNCSRTWTLLSSTSYLTSCLTQCHVQPSAKMMTTASTDGHVAFWSYEQLEHFQWTSRHKVHQNAILALESCHLDNGTLLLTGGDDNAVAFTLTEPDIRALIVPNAHAAAVTAVCVAPVSGRSNAWIVVSAGLDQRVKLWRVAVDVEKPGIEGVEVALLGQWHSAVADVSSVELIRLSKDKKGVLVCGVGMEVWSLDEERALARVK